MRGNDGQIFVVERKKLQIGHSAIDPIAVPMTGHSPEMAMRADKGHKTRQPIAQPADATRSAVIR